jgi:hypothetical protein
MGIDAITGAASQITGAIRQAARSTGASFEYLLTTARIESSLNPAAQASSSSAKGLYQFIDQTWLATMKSKGAALGYGRYADAIVQDASGQYDVPDPAARSAIMKLRTDPTASALMAGAFASNNAAQLTASIGRAPNEGELYIAHFLGADGAGKLITAATNQPRASAVAMFPQAAAANPSIFYTGAGSSRSVSEVYAKLTSRFEVARSVAFNLRGTLAPSPDTAGVTQAFATAISPPAIPDTRPLFQTMFTDRVRAVAQTVSELWTPPGAEANTARPLNLFSDAPSDPRKLFGS